MHRLTFSLSVTKRLRGKTKEVVRRELRNWTARLYTQTRERERERERERDRDRDRDRETETERQERTDRRADRRKGTIITLIKQWIVLIKRYSLTEVHLSALYKQFDKNHIYIHFNKSHLHTFQQTIFTYIATHFTMHVTIHADTHTVHCYRNAWSA